MAGNLSSLGFGGSQATTAVVNFHSSGGTQSTIGALLGSQSWKEVLSGSVTAATLKTLLTVSGSGLVPILAAYTKDATSRTVRLKVTADGVVIFDATSSTCTANDKGIYAAGTSSNPITHGEPIVFNSSLTVEVASSLTETDKVALGYVLHSR